MDKRLYTNAGVYRILCTTSGRFYIGSAVELRRRTTQHRSMLRKNKHYNKFLQAEWNKYSEQAFVFETVEVTSRETCLQREQAWLEKCFDNQEFCFNMQPNAGTNRGRKRTLEERQTLSKAKLGKPLYALSKTYNVLLVSPDGTVYGPIINSEQFAKKHQMHPGSLWKVLTGKVHTYHGWRLSTTPDDKELLRQRGLKIGKAKLGTKRPDVEKRHSKLVQRYLLSPNGEKVWLEKGISAFARMHNLSPYKLSLLLSNKRKSHKGWKCYES